jgi:hypothetical protein
LLLVLRRFRLWPALVRPQCARGHPLNAGRKAIVAERPADAFGCAQAIEQVRLRLVIEQVGKTGKTRADQLKHGDAIALAKKMGVLDQRQSRTRSTARARTGLSET